MSMHLTRRIAAGLAITIAAVPAAAVGAVAVTDFDTGQASVIAKSDSRTPKPPAGFTDGTKSVNGINMHYVMGGTGPTLVLLHGYPQSSYEWFGVMPELAKSYTVIAPDLRGAGGSSAPAGGYDKKTMAADVHELLKSLGKADAINLVGHDIGTMVAYAYADAHGDSVAKLALTEAPIPDEIVYSYPSLTPGGPGFWNFGFFSLKNGLPENAVDRNENEWVTGFIDWLTVNKAAFDKDDIDVYADALKDDAHLKASFEWFRAFPTDILDVAAGASTKLTMPVLAVGGDNSLGASVAEQVRTYADNVQGEVIANSGHWIWEERPAETTQLLLGFLAG